MIYNDTNQTKTMLYVILLGSFSVSGTPCPCHLQPRLAPCGKAPRYSRTGRDQCGTQGDQNVRPLLTSQAPNSIAQLVLVSLVAVLHLLWFLFLRPMEQTSDAASELFTSIVEILTYAGGLTLVVLARTSSGGGDPNTFLVISRAMLIFQGAGFAVFILTQMSSIYWTFKGIAENRRMDKVDQRFRDVKGCPSYQQVVVKRFANRWLNRVLRRPLLGWPRLGPWTLEEQALVLTLIDYYYQQTNGASISEKLLRELPKSVGYPFVWSVVGECRSTGRGSDPPRMVQPRFAPHGALCFTWGSRLRTPLSRLLPCAPVVADPSPNLPSYPT